jgi:hypothetical protein
MVDNRSKTKKSTALDFTVLVFINSMVRLDEADYAT